MSDSACTGLNLARLRRTTTPRRAGAVSDSAVHRRACEIGDPRRESAHMRGLVTTVAVDSNQRSSCGPSHVKDLQDLGRVAWPLIRAPCCEVSGCAACASPTHGSERGDQVAVVVTEDEETARWCVRRNRVVGRPPLA